MYDFTCKNTLALLVEEALFVQESLDFIVETLTAQYPAIHFIISGLRYVRAQF